jgi:hypothetical protein
MIEYLKVLLTPHMIWGLIVVFFAFRFKSSFRLLLEAITDRIKNVKGYEKTKDGHKLIFAESQLEKEENILPNTSETPPIGVHENKNDIHWVEDDEQDIGNLRSLVKSERATRYLWEYRYLNYFFARVTQLVLDWLIEQKIPITKTYFENYWLQLIPSEEERNIILNVLKAHYIIVIHENELIEVSPKGLEYHEWRGVLPAVEAKA